MRPIDAEPLEKILHLRCAQYSNDYGSLAGAISGCLKLVQAQPTLTPPLNPPLTLEELREMDGEPVFCRSLLTGKEGWAICRIAECGGKWYLAFSGGEQAYGDKDTIGENWLAYRRKPEEGVSYD